MIFQHTWEAVLAGKKTQTRRLCKSGERLSTPNSTVFFRGRQVFSATNHIKWAVGKDYAVQPGRGKKAVGHIRLTSIRQEHVQDITEADAIAEGCDGYDTCPTCGGYGIVPDMDCGYHPETGQYMEWETQRRCPKCQGVCAIPTMPPSYEYAALWDTIHTKPGMRWNDNPLVFVLEFELVEEA